MHIYIYIYVCVETFIHVHTCCACPERETPNSIYGCKIEKGWWRNGDCTHANDVKVMAWLMYDAVTPQTTALEITKYITTMSFERTCVVI